MLAATLVLAALSALVPSAGAHTCDGTTHADCDGHVCPDDGESHYHQTSHASDEHSCSSFADPPDGSGYGPGGKDYCEGPWDWFWHIYGPPATGAAVVGYYDSNLSGDCDGDGIPGDRDGHYEFAYGGAWILVDSGSGAASSDPSVGAGTLYCIGDEGHHAAFGPFNVYDQIVGFGASFTVASDSIDNIGTGEGCGDFETDQATDCIGSCTVSFPPGLDGTYVVFVTGFSGYVWTA